jgi:hypothetical protein
MNFARQIVRLSSGVADSDEARERLRLEAPYRLPGGFDEAGNPIGWRTRVSGRIFGGGTASDPSQEIFWDNLAEIARRPREKAMKSLRGNLRERVERVVAQRNRGTK